MNDVALYPLRFEPIFQYRPWGGRRLSSLLSAPLPGEDPVGEAWLLSDRDDHPTIVANGPLKGQTIHQLLHQAPGPMLGNLAGHFSRLPILLKLLDVRDALSVQVHPSDQQTDYLPPGESGKTEAWVVLEAGPKSRIYAGLTQGATRDDLRKAIRGSTMPDLLASFRPKLGDGIYIPAGTVHSLSDVVVFEVQENSDVTFRLYDWNHVDAKTGLPRPLQVEKALACVNLPQGAVGPVTPVVEAVSPAFRERLFHSEHFCLWRVRGKTSFTVGAEATPRVIVAIAGEGNLEHAGVKYPMAKGDVFLLPAVVGACLCRPRGDVSLLEISLPGEACTHEKAHRL